MFRDLSESMLEKVLQLRLIKPSIRKSLFIMAETCVEKTQITGEDNSQIFDFIHSLELFIYLLIHVLFIYRFEGRVSQKIKLSPA